MTDDRFRNWAFVVYPESAPENWREILDEHHIPWFESPLHDKDVNPTGEPKKPHWHVIITFAGKKGYESVKPITEEVNATRPEHVKDLRGYLRYFAHLDNPEKAQYSPHDIKAHAGADLGTLTNPTASERHACIKEMRAFCKENHIVEFCDLLDYAAESRPDDWFPLLCDNSAYVMQVYLTSLRHKVSPSIDPESGEIN